MNLLTNKRLRRFVGFSWHLAGVLVAYTLAFALRFDLAIPEAYRGIFLKTLPIFVGVFLTLIVVFRLYRGLWRFFTFSDCLRHALVFLLGTAICAGILFLGPLQQSFEGFPRSVFVTHFMLMLAWEIGGRGIVRLIRELQTDYLKRGDDLGQKQSIVVGSLAEADRFIRAYRSHQGGARTQLDAVVTSDPIAGRSTMHGARIHDGLESLDGLLSDGERRTIMILSPFNTPKAMSSIIDRASATKALCEFRVIPTVEDLASGKLDVSSLRKVEIKDLLSREPNAFDRDVLREAIGGKKVLVTGAGGSIGSEICRQVAGLGVAHLVLFEQSEFGLFAIEAELRRDHPDLEITPYAGDIRRAAHLEDAIAQVGGIEIVYHAAAYKHVHLMEKNVPACFHNNVLGSKAVADVAEAAGVKRFIMISTDKAVRPTSVMGASKRLAERLVLERETTGGEFIAVRFGNVLGSSGSVIPIFEKQIADGGPVTVTTPDTRRFFMTIPEAVELVLMAGTVGSHGDIMVLEMGEQVKIVDLARRLIELSGLRPDEDIEIKFIGLRPGEKEYEELLTEDENVGRTEHQKIWVMEKTGDRQEAVEVNEVEELVRAADGSGLRSLAKRLIAEHHLEGDDTRVTEPPSTAKEPVPTKR